jgi:glycosyltransferase involved in cell wall biosynthesis
VPIRHLNGDLMYVYIYSPSEKIWGGGQIYIENLCRYLNETGVSAAVATSEPETFNCPTLRIASVASKLRRLQAAPTLARTLKRQGVQVIVLNDLSSLWLAPVFRAFGLKVVSLLHLYLQRRNAAGLGHGYLEYHLLRFSSHFTHRIFSVNKDNQRSFPVSVEFVGNFISPWFFSASDSENKQYDIGLVARLSVEKNIPLFVQLVARLNEVSERPIQALIVGRGEEEAKVKQEIARLGMQHHIELQPWVERSDLPAVFDRLKCFAITSHHEGFATTVLEAHARGVPAISTRSAGYCAEFLTNIDPITGLAFDPVEVVSDDFVQRVLELIERHGDYRAHCIEKASLFSEERVLGDICRGIQSLLTNANTQQANQR